MPDDGKSLIYICDKFSLPNFRLTFKSSSVPRPPSSVRYFPNVIVGGHVLKVIITGGRTRMMKVQYEPKGICKDNNYLYRSQILGDLKFGES